MKISKYIHSCLLVEKEGQGILIDPGAFSFNEGLVSPETFRSLVAVLITHGHKDHYDVEALKVILKNNPDCQIFTNSELKNALDQSGVSSETFESGERDLGVFRVKAVEASHEPILFPAPQNTAYIIDDLILHPGDSTDPILFSYKVAAVALPVDGPWQTAVKALEFALSYEPKHVIPVHDGHIKDFFNQSFYQVWQKVCEEKGFKFYPLLKVGESIEVS